MERNTDDYSMIVADGKAASSRIQSDGRERRNPFLMGDAVVIAQRERTVTELCIPPDAVEELSERLHF
jgi:hypothetical protein